LFLFTLVKNLKKHNQSSVTYFVFFIKSDAMKHSFDGFEKQIEKIGQHFIAKIK